MGKLSSDGTVWIEQLMARLNCSRKRYFKAWLPAAWSVWENPPFSGARPQQIGARLKPLRKRAGTKSTVKKACGLSRRTRAIDHLLYEINSSLRCWVTGGCSN